MTIFKSSPNGGDFFCSYESENPGSTGNDFGLHKVLHII